MKQVAIIVRDPEDLIELKNQLVDFEYNEKCPDFVVSYGGDGTYLVSERLYPGIPKLLIKKEKSICAKCNQGDFYHLVSAILRNKFSIEENIKLKAGYNNHYLEGTNDIVIRNKYPTHALRFKVNVNSKDITKVIIGDGVVISTPFGSTAYYHSITRKRFDKGIGIAFSNTTKPVKHLVVDENSIVKIELVRGTAVLAADNDAEVLEPLEGQTITVTKSNQTAKIISMNSEHR